MEEKENPHKDHRKRLRSKVKDYGLDCLAYHEVLEMLLTYVIPRVDTNPIAQNLIEYFGSFDKVIDADYMDLLKVDGIGPESALFIKTISQFGDVYSKSKLETKVHILNNTAACVQFFRDIFPIKNNEYMIFVCLSKNKRVLNTYRYKGKDEAEISFELRQIVNNISNAGVDSVVLFHTHPNGSVEPSKQDISTTQSIINVCMMHGIIVSDHIILNESEHYSFDKNGLIDKMSSKYNSVFSTNDIFLKTVKVDKSEKIEIDEED